MPVLCMFRFVSYYRKNQVIIFQRAEENMGEEKKPNGDANQVDEERNWRSGIFLPISPSFDSTATHWGYDRSIPGLVTQFIL